MPSDAPVGPVRVGWPLVLIAPCEYAAEVGVTPAQYCAPLATLAVIDAEPPTWIWVFVSGGCSPPAHTAHGGSSHFTLVTVVWIFLIATGLTWSGTKPTAVIVRSFTAPPAATVTVNSPTPTATYVKPSYGAGTVTGSGSAIEPTAPGVVSPLVSAQSARSMPDSAIARACALLIWFMAMAGSLELKARKATVSAVSNVRMMSVIGRAMPSSDPCRRASKPFIDSSGERVDAADQRFRLRRRGHGVGLVALQVRAVQGVLDGHRRPRIVDVLEGHARRRGRRHGGAGAQIVDHAVHGHPRGLLHLDAPRAVLERVLALLQRHERARHDETDHRGGDQELAEGESLLVADDLHHCLGLHPVHRCAMYMLTVTVLATAAVVVLVNGWKVTATATWRMAESLMVPQAVTAQLVMRTVRE